MATQMAFYSHEQELTFILMQELRDRGFTETLHALEIESRLFFDMNYFGEVLKEGKWEEAENYLSGFTFVGENNYSFKLFYEIRKQNYLEALDKKEYVKALEILQNDLGLFSARYKKVIDDLTFLVTLDDIRENKELSDFGDTKSSREALFAIAKTLIEANPVFRNKLEFPKIEKERLKILMNQSLNLQHKGCDNMLCKLSSISLYEDHNCDQSEADADAYKRSVDAENSLRNEAQNMDITTIDQQGSVNCNPSLTLR